MHIVDDRIGGSGFEGPLSSLPSPPTSALTILLVLLSLPLSHSLLCQVLQEQRFDRPTEISLVLKGADPFQVLGLHQKPIVSSERHVCVTDM